MKTTISWKSPEFNRSLKEDNYHHEHEHDFRQPFRVFEQTDPSDISSTRLHVRNPDYSFRERTLATLEPKACQYFCLKDVCMYLNSTTYSKGGRRTGSRIFDTVYRYFFPHRDLAFDLDESHFFSCLVDFKPSRVLEHRGSQETGTVSEMTRFHEALCEKVESMVSVLKEEDKKLADGFGLTWTFKKAFLIIEDHESTEPDVVLVCRDEETAKHLNLKEEQRDNDPTAGCTGRSDPDISNAWPLRYRMGLAQAIQAICWVDEKRRVGVEPNTVFWRRDITKQEDFNIVE